MKSIFLSLFLSLNVLAQTGSPTRPANQQDPQNQEEQESSSKVPVSTGKYITGGILGSAIGLGIGHGVQGRYGDKGWIFTATGAAGLAMFLSGCNDYDDHDLDGDKECNDPDLALAGLVLSTGFHIWEIIDVWTGARPVNTEPTAMIIPDSKKLNFIVSWRF